MRISDWSSDVCSSDLDLQRVAERNAFGVDERGAGVGAFEVDLDLGDALGAVLVDELRGERVERYDEAGLAAVYAVIDGEGLIVLGEGQRPGRRGDGRAIGHRLHLTV